MSKQSATESTIFEQLRKDHQVQRELLNRLEQTSGSGQVRKQAFERLKEELTHHAAAEEKHFYAQLMSVDMTREKARHSVAEHHDIDEQVELLADTDFSSPQWLPRLKDLKHLVTHHLDEEEQEVFQVAGKALTDTQKTESGSQYRNEMSRMRQSGS